MVHGMEAKGKMWGSYYVPDGHLLYAAQVLTHQLYAKVITSLRDLAGGGRIMLPSSTQDFENPELARIIRKTPKSPVSSSEERVKCFQLGGDAIRSVLATLGRE